MMVRRASNLAPSFVVPEIRVAIETQQLSPKSHLRKVESLWMPHYSREAHARNSIYVFMGHKAHDSQIAKACSCWLLLGCWLPPSPPFAHVSPCCF